MSILNKFKKPVVQPAGGSGTPVASPRTPLQRVAFSKKTLDAMPILKNIQNEANLIWHCKLRMDLALPERDARHERCSQIDVQLNGFVKLDRDDQKRFKELLTKGKVKPVDHNLPLADAQLDDCSSYLMSIFAPDMNLFESSAPAAKAEMAKAVTQTINEQGQRGQYYRHFARVCTDALKYNFAAITCYWEKEQGYVFQGGEGGVLNKQVGTVWAGNALEACDVYNFFYDATQHPVDLPKKGEWFCQVDIMSPFRALKDQQDGKEFGVDRVYNSANNTLMTPQVSYYKPPPIVRDSLTGAVGGTDFVSILREQAGPAQESAAGIERWRYTTWLRPKDFGLSDSTALELWQIHIMQGAFITLAVKLDDSHGMLPVACASPIEDALKNQQRTYAERLLPLQHFSSFLLNTHQAGVRKSLYGVTVYNQSLFPGLDLSKEDLTSATIAMRGSAQGVDIDKAFRHYNTAPSTDQNVDMISKVDSIMQKILPTDLYRQVADLERATLYQAAATVQTGNRRSLKIARMVSNQCLEMLKMQMIFNIYANQEAIEYIKDDGTTDTVTPAQFVTLGLENYISNGLKGIDRLMIITAFKEVLAMILQSQQAIQELDIVKLLAYFFNLIGEAVDLNEFRKPIQQRVVDSTLANGAPPSGQPQPAPTEPAAATPPAGV